MGDMTALYLELGARVVSVEPQEECLKSLEVRFGRHPLVSIVPMAVGAVRGEQEMLLSDIRSPLSSMSPEVDRSCEIQWEISVLCLGSLRDCTSNHS